MISEEAKYIERCFFIANKGIGKTYPNPLVGCVIVSSGKIIGEGFHSKAGSDHAEIVAIKSVKNKQLLKNSTLYVSLEPCNHYGLTPPCTLSIEKYKIPRVVIGSQDFSSKVNGKGIEYLIQAKIDANVFEGSELNSISLNKRFFAFHRKKRPYIILKWAKSEDNFIDINRSFVSIEEAKPTVISNISSRQISHLWRSQEQAIMVGFNTVKNDNPSLNTRLVKGQSPIIVLIDRDLKIPIDSKIFKNNNKVWVFNHLKTEVHGNIKYFGLKQDKNNYVQVLDQLYKSGIQSIIIEGGAKTINSFIKLNLWDETREFIGKGVLLKNGVIAPCIKADLLESTRRIKGDTLKYYLNK